MPGHPYPPWNIDKILTSKKKKNGVWKRNSNLEIENVKIKLRNSSFTNLTMPLPASIVVLLLCMDLMPKSSSKLTYCIVIPLVVFVIIYGYQIFSGRSLASRPSFKVCNKCFKEDYIGLEKCPCGGTLEPPEFYTFIEESESDSKRPKGSGPS